MLFLIATQKKSVRFLFFLPILYCPGLRCKDPVDVTSQEWQHAQAQSDFFNPKKLADDAGMRKKLKEEEGFEEVDFQASDGIALKGLLRTMPGAEYTLINFCGFFPGKKEGMATLVELFPRTINMLLVDARGHGQSQGPFLSSGGTYGLYEPYDVIGAIKFAHQKTNNSPIIVHGLCMGGRHATIGLAQLSSTTSEKSSVPKIAEYNVRGFICDSAPTKASSLKHVFTQEVTNKMLPQWFKKIPGYNIPKKELQKTYAFKAAAATLSGIVKGVRYIWFDKNGIDINEMTGATNSIGKASRIACPVFFIHPQQDTYVCCAETSKVAQEVRDKTEWYNPDETEHVQLHVKRPEEYAKKCHEFIAQALKKPLPQKPTTPLPYQATSPEIFKILEKFWRHPVE